MLWPDDTTTTNIHPASPDFPSCSDTASDDSHDFASQPSDSYPSPPSSQHPPASSAFIPSAQPVYYRSLSPIIDTITPCPSLPSTSSVDSFAFVTPPRSPSASQSSTRRIDDSDAHQSELLDSIVDGIARVSVSMDRDEAGRWRIRRLPEDD